MLKDDDTKKHGKELSCDGDHDESKGAKVLDSFKDEKLTQATEKGVCNERRKSGRMGKEERDRF